MGLEDKFQKYHQLHTEFNALEEDLIEDAIEKFNIKEDLIEVVETMFDNYEFFDTSAAFMNALSALGKKSETSGGGKHCKKRKGKET